jgi:glucan-binding YG repeat protein
MYIMKKQFLFLAGSAILFASCGGNNNAENGADKAKQQIDSAAAAGAAQKEAAIKAANDSTIVAAAKAKADSEAIAKEAVAKDHAKHPGQSTKHTTTKTETPPPPPPPTSKNPKDARFNDNTKAEQQKTESNKKADRFK